MDIYGVVVTAECSERQLVEKMVALWANETDDETVADSAGYLVVWWVHVKVVKMDIVGVAVKDECSERSMVEKMVARTVHGLAALSAV